VCTYRVISVLLVKNGQSQGYRDYLLETARETVTIASQDVPSLSKIDIAAKAIFERLYLVPGLGPFGPRVNCSCTPTTHRSLAIYFSIFVQLFSQVSLTFFGHHDSPSNLAESQYLYNRGNKKVLITNLSQNCSERSQPFPHWVLWTG